MYVCVYICIYIYMFVCVYMYMYVCMCANGGALLYIENDKKIGNVRVRKIR